MSDSHFFVDVKRRIDVTVIANCSDARVFAIVLEEAVVLFLKFKYILKAARKPQQQYFSCHCSHSAVLLGIKGGNIVGKRLQYLTICGRKISAVGGVLFLTKLAITALFLFTFRGNNNISQTARSFCQIAVDIPLCNCGRKNIFETN